MAGITTDAQRDQWVQALKSGRITDTNQKRKVLTAIMAYDQQARGGDAPAGVPSGESLVPPSADPTAGVQARPPILQARTPIPGASREEVAQGQVRNRAIEQGAGRFFRRAGDLFKRITGQLSPEERETLRQERLQQRAEEDVELIARAKALGMTPEQVRAGQTIGGVVTEAAIGGGAGLIRSRAGRVIGEGLLSAFSAAASDSLSNDTGANALIWGSVGSGLALVFEVPGITRDFLLRDAKRTTKHFDTQRGFEVGNEFGVDLSLAEASLDEQVKKIESAVFETAGGPKHEFQQRRQVQVARSFLELVHRLNPENLSDGTLARTLSEGYSKHVRDLQQIATTNMRSTLAEAADAAGAVLDNRGRIVGGKPVLMPRNLLEEIESIKQAQDRVPLIAGPEADVQVRGVLERMFDENGQPIPMLLGDVETLWSGLSKATYGGADALASNLSAADRLGARNLLAALEEDLGQNVLVDDAVEILRAARDQYRKHKAPINALADTAFNKVLSNVGKMDSETFVRSLMKLDTEDLVEVMRLADKTKPGLSNAIRGRVFAGLLDRHTHRAATSTLQSTRREIDFAGLANEFANMPARKLDALVPIDTDPSTIKKAQAGISVLLRIAEGPNIRRAEGKGIVQRIENVAINAVSQNHFFLSRLAAGELSPRWLEKVFYTREGLQALANLGDPRINRAQAVAAVTGLARMLSESDAELEAARKEAERQRLENMQRTAQSIGF